jgi:hypothetical protein
MKDQNSLETLLKRVESPIEQAAALIELEAIAKGIKERISQYKAELLKVTQDLDVYSLKTGKYTITRAHRVTPRVTNFKDLKAALDEAKIPYGTKEVFDDYMSVVFKRAIEEKRELNGLEALETEYIMIRLPKEKKDSGTETPPGPEEKEWI